MNSVGASRSPARVCLLLLSSITVPAAAIAGELRPETVAAFNRYLTVAEQRIAKQLGDPRVFLYVNTLPAAERRQAFESLRQDEIYLTPLTTRDPSGGEMAIPDGMVHHWLGTVFIPRASVTDVLNVVQDYNHKQDVYPEVVKSRLISRDGEHFKAMMRFREHHVITVTLDTEHDVVYTELDPTHWYSRSYSTRVSQVEDAGKPGEHDLPDGDGNGFMWRIDTYWHFAQQDGGTYLEVEAISLSRAIPSGVGWMVKPFITSVPRESLHDTLSCTRAAVAVRLKAAGKSQGAGARDGTSGMKNHEPVRLRKKERTEVPDANQALRDFYRQSDRRARYHLLSGGVDLLSFPHRAVLCRSESGFRSLHAHRGRPGAVAARRKMVPAGTDSARSPHRSGSVPSVRIPEGVAVPQEAFLRRKPLSGPGFLGGDGSCARHH